MGVKYFCDKCGKEFNSNGLAIPIYARDGLGIELSFVKNKYLCEECAEKFNAIKDNLKYEDEFFDMTDADISSMKYEFKVGDIVITSTGKIGFIKSICDCESCKRRGFYEPSVETVFGVGAIWITDTDKENGFMSFYSIGRYYFGNIDKESVKYDIESETHKIEEATENKKMYQGQLDYLRILRGLEKMDEDYAKSRDISNCNFYSLSNTLKKHF